MEIINSYVFLSCLHMKNCFPALLYIICVSAAKHCFSVLLYITCASTAKHSLTAIILCVSLCLKDFVLVEANQV